MRTDHNEQRIKTLTVRLAAHDRALARAGVDVERAQKHARTSAETMRVFEAQAWERYEAAAKVASQLRSGLRDFEQLVQRAQLAAAALEAVSARPTHEPVPESDTEQLLGERLLVVLEERDALQLEVEKLRETSTTATLRLKEAEGGKGYVPAFLRNFVVGVKPGEDLPVDVLLALSAKCMNWAWDMSGSKMRITLGQKKDAALPAPDPETPAPDPETTAPAETTPSDAETPKRKWLPFQKAGR